MPLKMESARSTRPLKRWCFRARVFSHVPGQDASGLRKAAWRAIAGSREAWGENDVNLPTLVPEWLFWALIACLVLAAFQDAMMLKISNYICGAVLLLGVAGAVIAGPQVSLWENGVVFVLALAIGTFLFGRGIMGGGDIKLLAMIGAFLGWKPVLLTIMVGSLSGSLIGLSLIGLGDHHDTVFLGREITRNENISEETARKSAA